MIALADATPTRIAQALTNRDYISYSAMSTYMACPLRYYFRYIQRIPEEIVSSSLVFGTSIHAAVQHHYEAILDGGDTPDVDQLMDTFWTTWQSREEEDIVISYGKGEDRTTIAALAERVLEAFLASDASQPTGQIIGIEEELRGPIAIDTPDLLARVDLITETADTLIITDFKTSRSRWNATQAEESAGQLLLYSQLAHDLAPGKAIRLEFIVMTKTKQPSVERLHVHPNRQKVDRITRTIRHVWNAIESGVFYPAASHISCSTCPFREPCNNWNG